MKKNGWRVEIVDKNANILGKTNYYSKPDKLVELGKRLEKRIGRGTRFIRFHLENGFSG